LRQLEGVRALDEATAVVEQRSSERSACPKCAAAGAVRNGFADGLQRYRCRACGATFNALTGTSLARLRHRERWLAQAAALHEGLSVRQAARRLGLHPTTIFRWRHRWLARLCELKASQMPGVVEADETYQLRSYKGQKALLEKETTRWPRRRGGKAAKRGLSAEQVPILVLRSRSGDTSDFVLSNTGKVALKAVLPLALAGARLGAVHRR